jgi:hypothetical protein
MWSMAVVMVNEDANDQLEMLAVEDQEPIQTLRANRPHKPFRDTVGLRSAKRRANDLYPIAPEDLVETLGELLISIANQEAERFLRTANVHVSCRACRVTHGPLGLGVHPAKARDECRAR